MHERQWSNDSDRSRRRGALRNDPLPAPIPGEAYPLYGEHGNQVMSDRPYKQKIKYVFRNRQKPFFLHVRGGLCSAILLYIYKAQTQNFRSNSSSYLRYTTTRPEQQSRARTTATMRSASATLLAVASTFFAGANACLYFNATLTDTKLSGYSWDDANNNNAANPEDILCQGQNLDQESDGYWSVPCARADNATSDTVFDVFLNKDNTRFLDVIYKYSNPEAAGLQQGSGDPNPDEFYFNFRVGSVDGKFFKSREFCAQYDLFRLLKPEALKNPCDSLDSC